MMSWRAFVVLLPTVLIAPAPSALAQQDDIEMSDISGASEAPRRHFRLRHPAELSARRAAEIYQIAQHSMQVGYALSGAAAAVGYLQLPRYNTVPYLSATHGNHYVNNYANDVARAYGRFEDAGQLPVGSVVAKDSFAVTQSGGLLLGPLFLMEKMEAGFNPVSGDWRYTLISADGTLFGTTNGAGSERVRYCIGCHLAVEHQDHLYYIPQAVRVVRD